MRIGRIEVGVVEVPLVGVFATAHSTRTTQRAVVVRVVAEPGGHGWGSVEPTQGYSKASIAEVADATRGLAAPALVGHDPTNLVRAHALMRERCPIPEARAVIEMALVDLTGRALGLPAWRLLGGAARTTIRLNGWIGTVPPEQAAREAAAWAERGFTSVKVKVGHDLPADVERVAAVRTATGGRVEIRVDANEGMDVEGSIRLGLALEAYGVALLEQPVARQDIEGLARIRREVRVPIMADESVEGPESVIDLIRREAADLVKVKVMKQGGLLPTLWTAQVAAAGGRGVVIGHGFGLWLSTMAELHVAAACPAIVDGVESVGPLKMRDDVVRSRPEIAGGQVSLPEAPGLGVEPDDRLLRRYGWQPTTVTG